MLHYAVIKIKRFWDADGRYSTQTFVNIVVNLNPKGNFRQFKPRKGYFCGEVLMASLKVRLGIARMLVVRVPHISDRFFPTLHKTSVSIGWAVLKFNTLLRTGPPELRGIASPLLF